jgi:hypothetical protein
VLGYRDFAAPHIRIVEQHSYPQRTKLQNIHGEIKILQKLVDHILKMKIYVFSSQN